MRASEFARQRARIVQRMGPRIAALQRALAHLVREADATPLEANGRLQGWALPDGSVVCVKERFRDGHAAWDELVRIGRTRHGGAIPFRAYRCSFCEGWHLSSREAKH